MIEKLPNIKIARTLPTVYEGEEMSLLELTGANTAKVNECINVVNEITGKVDKLEKDVQEFEQTLTSEYLPELVSEKLDELVENGTMEELINQEVLSDINNRVQNKLDKVTFNSVQVNILDFGAISDDPEFDNIPAIQAAADFIRDNGGGTVFIPAGVFYVKPTTTHYIDINYNVKFVGGDGAVLRIAPGEVSFRTLFRGVDEGFSVEFHNITYDGNIQNTIHDIILNVSAQYFCMFALHDSLIVKNCKFINQGGTNVIVASGGYDKSYFEVSNCEFDFVRGNTTGVSHGEAWYDVSTIYCDALIAKIYNNTFICKDPEYQPQTCIEPHAAIQYINNNYIKNYNVAILTHLAQYTGITGNYTEMKWNITNNIIDDCMTGIQFQTFNDHGPEVNYKNITVANNIIQLNPAAFSAKAYARAQISTGIIFSNRGPANHIYYDININNNIIEFDYKGITTQRDENQQSGEIGLRMMGQASYKNINITNNSFNNIPSYGILLERIGASTAPENINITGNTFNNIGCKMSESKANYKSVLFFSDGNGLELQRCVFKNNIINDNGNPANTYYILNLSSVNMIKSRKNLVADGNIINSKYGDPGSILRRPANKEIYGISPVKYTPDLSAVNRLHRNDIVVTPYRIYKVGASDGETGSLLTANGQPVTAEVTAGNTFVNVNDTTNIKADDVLKITDGNNTIWPTVDCVVSPTRIKLTSPSTYSFDPVNAVITYNAPALSDVYNDNYGAAAPTSGTWKKGDKVYNSNPAVGGYVGWICTVAGTPGTWQPFGKIE